MNKQRQAVYGCARQLLEGVEQKDRVSEMAGGIVGTFIDLRCPRAPTPRTTNLDGFRTDVLSQFGVKLDLNELRQMNRQEIEDYTNELLMKKYQEKKTSSAPTSCARLNAW